MQLAPILLERLDRDDAYRNGLFPVTKSNIYMAHAAVCPLPTPVADAISRFASEGSRGNQETPLVDQQDKDARSRAAQLIGAAPDEIALLGPTSLGLSLVANGLDWRAGDEVVFYKDDYPANVYAWLALERFGVRCVRIQTEHPGVIRWPDIERVLTKQTRLVALASCNFLSGFRIDIAEIGRRLHERGILFCLDGIQTIGAFDTPVEYVDFMSADSHKWMLGPAAAGIVYVAKRHHDTLRPSLLGAWNVRSPEFVAQHEVEYYWGARRYEPGILNYPGIAGLSAALELLLGVGPSAIEARLLMLRFALLDGLLAKGYKMYLDDEACGANQDEVSAIVTVFHPEKDMAAVHADLAANGVSASVRRNRAGQTFVRLSPHFYITLNDVDKVVALM